LLEACNLEIVGDWPVGEVEKGELYVADGQVCEAGNYIHLATYKYKVRDRKPRLKDHKPVPFRELPKDQQKRIACAIIDDPGGVLYRGPDGVYRCMSTPAICLGTRYVIASDYDLTGCEATR
jgi:hypothetical protein